MSIRTKIGKRKKGFTLIELIIVIAIIAILSAIAIPNFLAIQRKARVKADIATGKTIYDATVALIAEGKEGFNMPEKVITEDSEGKHVEYGYGIDLSRDDGMAKILKDYIGNNKNLKPQSAKDCHFYVNVEFGKSSDGSNDGNDLNKPIIQVSIINSNNDSIGDVFPNTDKDFK